MSKNAMAPRRAQRGIFRRKSIADIRDQLIQGELKQTLGPWSLVFLGIGSIIGTGIFVLTGRAAAQFAGPGIMISFIVTGVLCAFVALCYAELASALPVSGACYSYTYASLGEAAAWIMGLLLLLEYGLAASAVAVGWSGYLVSLLADIHINLPGSLTAAPGVRVLDSAGHISAIGIVNLPAIGLVAFITGVLVIGISESAAVNNTMVAVKLAVIVAFILIGAHYVNTAHWTPLIPAEVPQRPMGTPMGTTDQIARALWEVMTASGHTRYGVGGVIHAAAVIFFAYLGFETVSTAGAEARNPSRDMPVGILGSLAICTILYILTAAVLVGIVPYTSLDNPAPMATAVNQIGLPWFAAFVKIGALAGLSSVILVLIYGLTRVFYTMSRDGLLPVFLSRVHPRLRTPWIITLIVGVATACTSGFLSLDALAELSNVGSLTVFAMVCVAVMRLRVISPEMPRPFRIPFYPAVPIIGISMCAMLLMSLMETRDTRNFFIGYLAVGLVVYGVFGFRNSRLGKGMQAAPDEATPLELPPAVGLD